jgi:hypothetical protein
MLPLLLLLLQASKSLMSETDGLAWEPHITCHADTRMTLLQLPPTFPHCSRINHSLEI